MLPGCLRAGHLGGGGTGGIWRVEEAQTSLPLDPACSILSLLSSSFALLLSPPFSSPSSLPSLNRGSSLVIH